MNKSIIVLSLLLLYSCSKKKILKIKDLNLSDIHQQTIIKYKIKESYLISDFKNYHYNKNDTINFKKYNKNGNIIYEDTGGGTFAYKYNNLNLLVQENFSYLFSYKNEFDYSFDSDNLVLNRNLLNYDTIYKIYKFNEKGNIIKHEGYINNRFDRKETIEYRYNSSNILKSKKTSININKTEDTLYLEDLWNENANYFYTNRKIDSTITILNHIKGKRSYKRKTIYDDNGLKNKTFEIYNDIDTLIYLYKYKWF